MYLLLFVIAAISTTIANPVPADEAHREKPLVFSLGKDDPPSAYRDRTLPDAGSYGTLLNKHQIPSGITSEYPVGDMPLPLQATKALNAPKEPGLHIPKDAYRGQEWRYSWNIPHDGAQPDPECGGTKSVCCTNNFRRRSSGLKTCKHKGMNPQWLFRWGSPCEDPQTFDSCDKLWAVIDNGNTTMDDAVDRRKVILKDGRPIFMAPRTKSQGITCFSDCKR